MGKGTKANNNNNHSRALEWQPYSNRVLRDKYTKENPQLCRISLLGAKAKPPETETTPLSTGRTSLSHPPSSPPMTCIAAVSCAANFPTTALGPERGAAAPRLITGTRASAKSKSLAAAPIVLLLRKPPVDAEELVKVNHTK